MQPPLQSHFLQPLSLQKNDFPSGKLHHVNNNSRLPCASPSLSPFVYQILEMDKQSMQPTLTETLLMSTHYMFSSRTKKNITVFCAKPRSAVGNVSDCRNVSYCRSRSWPGPILLRRLIMK